MNEFALTRKEKFNKALKRLYADKFLYLLLLPSVVLTIMFSYVPMWGVKMAFQDYNIFNPSASEWVGMANFIELFQTDGITKAIWNTLYMSLVSIAIGFPPSIVFALLLNEIRNPLFKRVTQTISYLPHFLSIISVIGIATALYSKYGPVNTIISAITGTESTTLWMAEQGFVVPNVLIIGIWCSLGWGSIVYLAAITGIDPTLYEAATVDGAGRFRQVIHITLPTILPTIVIMLLWRVGSMLSDNFELMYGLQNPYIDYEVISTLVYKEGIQAGNYSMSTALGLFQGVVNITTLVVINFFAKKLTGTGLF